MLRPDFTTAEIAELLRDVRGARCKSSHAQGCRCPEHGGPATNKSRLVAVADADGVAIVKACDGSMTCGCDRCVDQRAALVRIGGRGSGARQPWQPLRAVA